MKIVFDLDDTVCMTNEYSDYYILKYIKDNNLKIEKIRDVSRFADGKYDWNEEQAKNWYRKNGDKMMSEFPCKPKAIEIINYLKDKGHTISIVTARSSDWHIDPVKVSIEWLKKNNIKYSEICFGRNDKENVCKEINADVFVDDDLEITKNVAKVFAGQNNKAVFLMNSDYNNQFKEAEGVIRINNFDELLEKLTELKLV